MEDGVIGLSGFLENKTVFVVISTKIACLPTVSIAWLALEFIRIKIVTNKARLIIIITPTQISTFF
jgi:hypothetical protein